MVEEATIVEAAEAEAAVVKKAATEASVIDVAFPVSGSSYTALILSLFALPAVDNVHQSSAWPSHHPR